MFRDRPITKRTLGVLLILLGAAAILATLLADPAGLGRDSGFGPTQRLAVMAGLGLAALGASLLPLGNRPA